MQRFIPLVDPSGSGKSSLLRAGVLPRLSVRWSVIGPVEPGGNPFLSLANALANPGVDGHRQAERFARLLRDEAVKLRDSAPAAGQVGTGTLSARLTTFQSSKSRLLLVIDQWEDVVTQSPPHERTLFLALLQDAVTRHRALHVLIALRPETLAEFDTSFPQPLLGTPVAIGSLEPRLLKEAIMRPADAAGITTWTKRLRPCEKCSRSGFTLTVSVASYFRPAIAVEERRVMHTILTLLVGITGAQLVSLGTLALRLRCLVMRDRQRHDTLTMLAARLPADGTIELDDAGHGGCVRLRVTNGQQGKQESDVRARTR